MIAMNVSRAAMLGTVLLSTCAFAQTPQQSNDQVSTKDKIQNAYRSATGNPLAEIDVDMKHVLDAMASLSPKPLPKLTAAEARQQPTAGDGAMQVLREQGKGTLPDPP